MSEEVVFHVNYWCLGFFGGVGEYNWWLIDLKGGVVVERGIGRIGYSVFSCFLLCFLPATVGPR